MEGLGDPDKQDSIRGHKPNFIVRIEHYKEMRVKGGDYLPMDRGATLANP